MSRATDRRRRAAWSSAFALALVVAVLSACAGTPSASGTTPAPCSSNAQCGANETCTYDVHQGCSASGYCAATATGACVAEYACGCNGGTIQVCLVGGEAPFALAHLGTCDGGVPAAYLPDATTAPPPEPDASEPDGGSD